MLENRRRNGRNAEDALLDEINLRLLAELQADARLSLAELGRRVGLSSPAIAERVARLEQEQVILGYHAQLNPRALGFALSAVIRAKPGPRQLHLVGELAAHGQTTTSIIQSTPVPARGITLDAQPET